MEIKSISHKIFKTSPKTIENNSNHTNPFGVSFKGNMISADVFDSSAENKISFGINLAAKVSNLKSKMAASAFVGSINDMSKAISCRLDKVVDFSKKIGKNAAKLGHWLHNTNLSFTFDAKLVARKTKDIKDMVKVKINRSIETIDAIRPKFINVVNAMEEV